MRNRLQQPLTWARLAGAATAAAAAILLGTHVAGGDEWFHNVAWLAADAILLWRMARRRWRFAAAVWFAVTPVLRLVDHLDSPAQGEILPLVILLGLGVGASLAWPRFS